MSTLEKALQHIAGTGGHGYKAAAAYKMGIQRHMISRWLRDGSIGNKHLKRIMVLTGEGFDYTGLMRDIHRLSGGTVWR